MSAPLALWADERSSASLRVLGVLAHKQLAFTLHPVGLLAGEHLGEAHAARNPAMAVPTLGLPDGRLLSQSLAICEFLEALQPQPALLPDEAFERARVLAVCQYIAADIHPLTNLRVRQEVARLKGSGGEQASRGWVKRWTATGIAALERMLAPTAGTHCFGDAPTLADFFLAPQAFNARRAGLLLEPYPVVSRVYAAALAQPAFERLRRLDEAFSPA